MRLLLRCVAFTFYLLASLTDKGFASNVFLVVGCVGDYEETGAVAGSPAPTEVTYYMVTEIDDFLITEDDNNLITGTNIE